jgi:hypothetical protein
VWDGSVTEEWPDQLDSTAADIQICSTTFIYKTYLYGGTEIAELNPNKIKGIGIGFFKDNDFKPIDFGSGEGFDLSSSIGDIIDKVETELSSSHQENDKPAPMPYPRGKGIVFYAVPSLYQNCSLYLHDLYNNKIKEPEMDYIPGKYGFNSDPTLKTTIDGKKLNSTDALSSYM